MSDRNISPDITAAEVARNILRRELFVALDAARAKAAPCGFGVPQEVDKLFVRLLNVVAERRGE